jgi:hypothetical protein
VFENYKNIKDDEFVDLLNNYMNYSETLENEAREFLMARDFLNLYTPQFADADYYYRALLSIDNIIINDEIIECVYQANQSSIETVMTEMLWDKNIEKIPRVKIKVAEFIRFIKKNKDLISIGAIQIVGNKSSALHQATKNQMYINDADLENLYQFVGNKNVASEYLKSTTYKSFQFVSDEGHVRNCKEGEISNYIMIDIDGCTSDYVNVYNYSTMEVISYNEETRICTFKINKNTLPESYEVYENWAVSSLHRTISEHYKDFAIDFQFAYYLNSSFASKCPFVNKILPYFNNEQKPILKMLEVESPILNNLSVEYVAKVKRDYGESFDAYKMILKNTAGKIQFAQSDNEINFLNKEFKERILDEGMPEVEKALKMIKKSTALNAAIDFGLLAIGMTTMPPAMAAAALQTGKTLYDYKNKMDEIKRHPSYFILKTR